MASVKTGFCIATALAAALLVTACDQAQTPADAPAPVAEAPPPVPAPAPVPVPISIVGDFSTTDAWQSYGGGPAVESLVDGAYTFAPNIGVMSRKSLPAKEGDKFITDYTVNLVEAPKSEKPAQYVVGPMFLDASGAVLGWGNVEQPLTEETRTGHFESVAPAGTVIAHLYIAGLWSAEGTLPDGKIAYSSANLKAVE